MTLTADSAPSLTHQGLIYGSDEQFLDAMVPFCVQGLQAGDAVLAVTTAANTDLLRQSLGADARRVEFVDAGHWYRAPGRTLGEYHRYVDRHTAGGGHRQVRVIGEPVWHGRDQDETAEWTRYEAIINRAFATCPAWIVCPYDTRALPSGVVEDARRTHPELLSGTRAQASAQYADPVRAARAWSPEGERPAPPAGREQTAMRFQADLTPLRAFVADAAAALGLGPAEVQRLVFAVNEVATNTVRHGGGSGRVRLWRGDRRLVCELTDHGPGLTGDVDWHQGYLPPASTGTDGHGLWTVRQLCDLMEIRTRPDGLTVRLHLTLT